jgi:hypothetical protein
MHLSVKHLSGKDIPLHQPAVSLPRFMSDEYEGMRGECGETRQSPELNVVIDRVDGSVSFPFRDET